MPKGFAARVTDQVLHPTPPALGSGVGSQNVRIGGLPAWRGMPRGAAGGLKQAKADADKEIKTAEAMTRQATGTPGYAVAKNAEQGLKAEKARAMTSQILETVANLASSGGGMIDVHSCSTLLPLPPHGPGVVTEGSSTVLINGLPACRMGDTLLEAIGPENKIVRGCTSVIIGD
jgi:uncharacterized Zn-binding protein involved in type VI secretion